MRGQKGKGRKEVLANISILIDDRTRGIIIIEICERVEFVIDE